jgi:hypothetical protein
MTLSFDAKAVVAVDVVAAAAALTRSGFCLVGYRAVEMGHAVCAGDAVDCRAMPVTPAKLPLATLSIGNAALATGAEQPAVAKMARHWIPSTDSLPIAFVVDRALVGVAVDAVPAAENCVGFEALGIETVTVVAVATCTASVES